MKNVPEGSPAKASLKSGRQGFGSMRGQSLVEFALVVPLFLLLVFALLDFGHLFLVQAAVQSAVRDAARFASTGNHVPDPNNPQQNLSRVNSIIQVAQQETAGIIALNNVQVSSQGGGTGSAGGPGDMVTVSVTANASLMTPVIARLFPSGSYNFTVSTTFKNEPFPPANTN